MNPFSEDNLVEKTVIQLIKEVWGDEECHINAFSDSEDAKLGRENRGEVVLKKYLIPALSRLNPDFPKEAINDAVAQITRDRSHLSLIKANQEIYAMLRDGVNVTVRKSDGTSYDDKIKFFDFGTPSNNDFLCVSQLWIMGEMYKRRPDVILYVNGIPLIIMELKATHKNLSNAHRDNLRDYQDTIPKLFWYNMGVVISNGIENKFGSFSSPFEFFNEWKKVEKEEDETKTDIRTLVTGVFERSRFLDIFENFILYDHARGKTNKIVPRYFQYYGVNKAFERIIHRDQLEGKLGVFWHTQGSGKSYSMVFLSQKVFRKLTGNYTFVIVTDRTALDTQAYDNFAHVDAIYEKEVHAESISHLHQLLSQDHRQVFTTIQKFQNVTNSISERNDVIVMNDEAHRTQYDSMAQNMRKALPNASFIGFTGTPLLAKGEEKTRETFGDYVSVYNFGQSVTDKSTVPLYYENRVPKLQNVNHNLEHEVQRVMEFYDLHDEDEERVEHEFSTFYHLITREDRLNAIARDIVTHFVGRGYNGKAMVVSIDKKTTIRMYAKVEAEWERYISKLRMDLVRTQDEREKEKIQKQLEQHADVDMAVVVSTGQNEIADMEEFEIDMKPIRQRMIKENLEEEFKKPDSNLRIVFVCAMWLTGFDVPNLSTLYLDKPLNNHTLMQTIARANRVAEGKKNGTIVDYIGVFRNIQYALALYAANGVNTGDIIRDKSQLVGELEYALEKARNFLQKLNVDLLRLLQASNEKKLELIALAIDSIVSDSETKKQYFTYATAVQNTYDSLLPDPAAERYYQEVTAIRVLASRVRDVGVFSFDTTSVKKDIEEILDKSILAGPFTINAPKRIKDLSLLDADKLREYFDSLEQKNTQLESIKVELEKKIEQMMSVNLARASFMERLLKILSNYNSGANDIDDTFDKLLDLARDLNTEENRAEKECLSEEELAVLDLLSKDTLNYIVREKVKQSIHKLMLTLEEEYFVLDWKEKEATRAAVRTTILDSLYQALPLSIYSQDDCDRLSASTYNYVFEHC